MLTPMPRPSAFDVLDHDFHEAPDPEARAAERWVYTDRLSYVPGETVVVHAHGDGEPFDLVLQRDDGASPPLTVAQGVRAERQALPPRFWETGCGWPEVVAFGLPADLPSGFYRLRATSAGGGPDPAACDHGFVVRAGRERRRALLVTASSTWLAYNDWGGANAYALAAGDGVEPFASRLSIYRPWARGFVTSPPGAPRKPHRETPAPGAPPRYPPIAYAFAHGLSRWYANAGWASYERPFCRWAEGAGYAFDYATQHDLDARPDLLDGYDALIVVGHDEYWSWAMRDAVDAFVDRGGGFARFGGNIAWQVRLEEAGAVQVCFKDRAADLDPLARTPRQTGLWGDPVVGRPPETTFGLSTLWGVYAGVGGQAGRGPGGFSVYRPEHWAFAGTGLGYGDMFGQSSRVFGYEVDGLDYVVRDGLPAPVPGSPAPPSLQILAMGLAANTEVGVPGARLYYGDSAPFLARHRYGPGHPDPMGAAGRGSGMIVAFERGAGRVFDAGSSEWVAGLQDAEPLTCAITANVLDRFGVERR